MGAGSCQQPTPHASSLSNLGLTGAGVSEGAVRSNSEAARGRCLLEIVQFPHRRHAVLVGSRNGLEGARWTKPDIRPLGRAHDNFAIIAPRLGAVEGENLVGHLEGDTRSAVDRD